MLILTYCAVDIIPRWEQIKKFKNEHIHAQYGHCIRRVVIQHSLADALLGMYSYQLLLTLGLFFPLLIQKSTKRKLFISKTSMIFESDKKMEVSTFYCTLVHKTLRRVLGQRRGCGLSPQCIPVFADKYINKFY